MSYDRQRRDAGIDRSAHPFLLGRHLAGAEADASGSQSAVNACIDTASAGIDTFAGFQARVIARTRILADLNTFFARIYGFSRSISVGSECASPRLQAEIPVWPRWTWHLALSTA